MKGFESSTRSRMDQDLRSNPGTRARWELRLSPVRKEHVERVLPSFQPLPSSERLHPPLLKLL
jgi:hypothetical protein